MTGQPTDQDIKDGLDAIQEDQGQLQPECNCKGCVPDNPLKSDRRTQLGMELQRDLIKAGMAGLRNDVPSAVEIASDPLTLTANELKMLRGALTLAVDVLMESGEMPWTAISYGTLATKIDYLLSSGSQITVIPF